MLRLLVLTSSLVIIPQVTGHGAMVKPYNWFDAGGLVGMNPGGQCQAEVDYGENGPFVYLDIVTGEWVKTKFYIRKGSACMWHNNQTYTPHPPTLDPALRTYQNYTIPGTNKTIDYTARNPWRSPGSASIFSPCGVAGGNPNGCPVGAPASDCAGGGYSYGPRAEKLKLNDSMVTSWNVGGVEEVAWSFVANHGGGYSYRLCKVDNLDEAGSISEECFQEIPLDFVGDTQWIQYGEDGLNRTAIPAVRTSQGTYPPGSEWTRVPIPACLDPINNGGGFFFSNTSCPYGTHFPESGAGLHGYGSRYQAAGKPDFQWSIVDLVKIPEDLVPGFYILSFRWDCEQTPQVWNTCANLRMTLGSEKSV